ncbi:MAG: hypothetical protein KC486_07495 [Myxococcales bacterium]|nr:hypothetical protein [Myxococcales bacterium]
MRRLAALATGLALAAGLACGLISDGLDGSLTSDAPTLGSWTFVPDTCESGQRRGFNGVSLYDDDHPEIAIDVVDDPLDGLALAVDGVQCDDRTTCTPVVLYASDCPALDGYIYRNTSVSTNNVWHVEGWVSVECELPGGGRLRGDVNFDGCH